MDHSIIFRLAGLSLALALACLQPARAQGDSPVRALSRDFVNQIRVSGQKITDVIYDTEALEIEADKGKGIVFARVRPNWLAQGGTRTAAFVNTAASSTGVTFSVEDLPSQVIELIPERVSAVPEGEPETALSQALSLSLPRFSADDYVSELKSLVRQALNGGLGGGDEGGTVFSPADGGRRAAPLRFQPRRGRLGRLSLSEDQAWVTADKVIELLRVSNLTGAAQALDPAALSDLSDGVLACAVESGELAPGARAAAVIVRSRRQALAAGLRAGAGGLQLSLDGPTVRLPADGEGR